MGFKIIENSGPEAYPNIKVEKDDEKNIIKGQVGPLKFCSWYDKGYNAYVCWPKENESCIHPDTLFEISGKIADILKGRLK